MSDREFSHQVLAMILAKRDKGSVSRYLDKLNQFVLGNDIPEEKKDEMLRMIEDFFNEEDELFKAFISKIDLLLGAHVK